MALARRRFLQTFTMAGGVGAVARGQEPPLALNVLRDASIVHGTALSEDRLRVIRPALERRLHDLAAFRKFEIEDEVGPAAGIS